MPQKGFVSPFLAFGSADGGEICCLVIPPAGSLSCSTRVPGVHSNPRHCTEEQRQTGEEVDA